MYKKIVLANIDKIHTTKMRIDRIKRNLDINNIDVVEFCKNKLLDKDCNIYKKGKNFYCQIHNIVITINSFSYTIFNNNSSSNFGILSMAQLYFLTGNKMEI